MKFEGSKLHNKYNDDWNTKVVPAYKIIKKPISLGAKGKYSDKESNFIPMIEQYVSNVKKIVDDLLRELKNNSFEDEDVVEAYISLAIKEALKDLITCRPEFEMWFASHSKSVKLIDKTMAELRAYSLAPTKEELEEAMQVETDEEEYTETDEDIDADEAEIEELDENMYRPGL